MDALICSVDVVLLTIKSGSLHLALLKRDREPFKGTWALPGGYIHPEDDASAAAAARRVLKDKAGIDSPYLEQLATFSGPGRDPRGWSISIAHYALVPAALIEQTGRPEVRLVPVDALEGLPFDHREIVAAALGRVRSKSQYSSLPAHLCAPEFTLPKLQAVYEAVLGEPINKVSFRRKMDEMAMLEAVPGALETGKANRPAQLYRLKGEFRHALALAERGLNT